MIVWADGLNNSKRQAEPISFKEESAFRQVGNWELIIHKYSWTLFSTLAFLAERWSLTRTQAITVKCT